MVPRNTCRWKRDKRVLSTLGPDYVPLCMHAVGRTVNRYHGGPYEIGPNIVSKNRETYSFFVCTVGPI